MLQPATSVSGMAGDHTPGSTAHPEKPPATTVRRKGTTSHTVSLKLPGSLKITLGRCFLSSGERGSTSWNESLSVNGQTAIFKMDIGVEVSVTTEETMNRPTRDTKLERRSTTKCLVTANKLHSM